MIGEGPLKMRQTNKKTTPTFYNHKKSPKLIQIPPTIFHSADCTKNAVAPEVVKFLNGINQIIENDIRLPFQF